MNLGWPVWTHPDITLGRIGVLPDRFETQPSQRNHTLGCLHVDAMARQAEIADLQLLAMADKNVASGQVTMRDSKCLDVSL